MKSAKSSMLKLDSFKLGSGNQLNVHNYLQCYVLWPKQKNHSFIFKSPLKKSSETYQKPHS